jgi:3-deoxy-7-phosphoheptulonate synthase
MTTLDPSPADRTSDTDDQRIDQIVPLPPPEHLIRFFPIADSPTEKLVEDSRREIVRILSGESDRLLVIIGPCSIHDPKAALEIAC